MDGTPRAAKRPATILAGPYGHPLHPILVTVPIGAWISVLVFDVGAQISGRSAALATGAQWLIAIGVIGALVAAAAGVLDLLTIPSGTKARRTAVIHLGLNSVVTLGFAVYFLVRVRNEFSPDEPDQWYLLLADVVLLGALAVSGYLGGMLAYRYGVRVADEDTQREGFDPRIADR